MFYAIQLWAHWGLLCAAAWLNRDDQKKLALTLVVAAGFFAPITRTELPELFYAQCFLIEMSVACAAMFIRAGAASSMVVAISSLLGIAHLIGMFVGPQPGVGPYRVTIPILELAQFLVCICMSSPVFGAFKTRFLKEHQCR